MRELELECEKESHQSTKDLLNNEIARKENELERVNKIAFDQLKELNDEIRE